MKIIMFSVREDEKEAIRQWGERHGAHITTVPEDMTPENIGLVKGNDGLCLQQRVVLADPAVYETLADYGIRQIAVRTAGYDIIDLKEADRNGLVITNVPAYSPNSVAELVVAQAMRLIRNLPLFEERMGRQDFRWAGLMAREIRSLTVGIIGAGRIGGTAAALFKGLGATVIAYDPVQREDLKGILTYKPSQKEVLAEADIVSLHVPLDETTRHLIDKEALSFMKPDAFLLNAARGPVVDVAALITALKEKKLAGAALDTLPNEEHFFNHDLTEKDLPDENLKILREMPNVLLTPHVGFYTNTAVKNMVDIGLDSMLEVLETGKSVNQVNQFRASTT